jgi:MFS family permease
MATPEIKETKEPRLLYRTPIKLILVMEGVSSLVNQLFQVLLPWYILASAGSVAWMAVAAFATIAPGIPSALWGGRVIDRFGRSATMLVCEVCQLLLICAIPLLIITGKARPWAISLIIFLSAFFDAPGQIARTALIPTYSRWAALPLHRVSGFKEVIGGMSAVIGPVAGGLIIASCGTLNAWVIAAGLCFLIVAIAVFFFNKRKPRVQPNDTTYPQVWQGMRRDKFLLQVILFTLPLFILGESWELLILPVYTHTFNHTSVFLGVLEAAFGFGVFIGALYFAAFGKKFRFFTLLTINYFAYALSIIVLMYNLPKTSVIAATFISGLPFGAFGAMVTTILLSRAVGDMRGKMLGLFAAGAAFTESIFILIIGLMLQKAGLFNTLFTAVIIFISLILASLFVRKYEDPPPPGTPKNPGNPPIK